jgi:hypothetical protein
VEFDKLNGKYVNIESAVTQLNRYKRWMKLWCDHNVSCTISFDVSERDEIVDWLYNNWDDDFVAVAFMFRCKPGMRASDFNAAYLPQEVVEEKDYEEYVSKVSPVDWNYKDSGIFEVIDEKGCVNGTCPIK